MTENKIPGERNRSEELTQKHDNSISSSLTSRRRLLQLLGASGVIGVAGCAGGDQGAQQQIEQSSGSATIALSSSPTEASDAPKFGGVAPAESLPIHERLTVDNRELELVPQLATEWEMIDKTTWEFTLREGVEFHNGVTLTADVAAASLNPIAELAAEHGLTEDSFSAVDEQTLRIETTSPNPLIPNAMSEMRLKLQYRGDEGGDGPIGTGPFKVADGVTKGKPVTVTAFDNYWADPPALNELVFQGITDSKTRALSLESGDVDVAEELSPTRYGPFKEADEIVVETETMRQTLYVLMNAHDPPTDDTKVRSALHWLVDQEALLQTFLEGIGTPAVGPFSPVFPWSISEGISSYGPDMERAQELVDESNYDGEELDLAVHGGEPIHKQIGQRIQQRANSIGLNINVLSIDPSSLWNQFWNGEFNLVLQSFYSLGPSNIYVFIHSEGLMNRAMGPPTTNPPNVEIDPLIEEALSTFDTEERREILAELQRRIMEGRTVLPLVHMKHIFGKRADLSGPAEIHPDPWEQGWSTLDRT